MNYSVEWSADALTALATVWMQAPDRAAVTAAQDRIDRLLAADPLAHGTPVSEGLYAITAHPLRALFEVASASRRVKVVGVRQLS
jgi:hypothetical protein